MAKVLYALAPSPLSCKPVNICVDRDSKHFHIPVINQIENMLSSHIYNDTFFNPFSYFTKKI